jgi:hypothetical protein
MSLGGGPLENADFKRMSISSQLEPPRTGQHAWQRDTKSLFQRLRERLRPHRQELGDDSNSSQGPVGDPSH